MIFKFCFVIYSLVNSLTNKTLYQKGRLDPEQYKG